MSISLLHEPFVQTASLHLQRVAPDANGRRHRGIEERAGAEVVDEPRQCGAEVGSRPVAPQQAARHGVTGLR